MDGRVPGKKVFVPSIGSTECWRQYWNFLPDMTKCSSARNSRITLFHSNKHFIFPVDPVPQRHSYLWSKSIQQKNHQRSSKKPGKNWQFPRDCNLTLNSSCAKHCSLIKHVSLWWGDNSVKFLKLCFCLCSLYLHLDLGLVSDYLCGKIVSFNL